MAHLLSFCVLSPWPPTWFEWSLSHPDCFKSQRWGNDNILSFLWIFHFIPAEAKPHHVGQISVFMGLNRRSEGMCFNFHLQFNYSLHGSLERPSLPTLRYLLEHQENRAASCSALSGIIFFPQTLKLFEPLCLLLIRGYTDMRILLLCFVLFFLGQMILDI